MVLTANAKIWTVGPNHNEEADRADCNLYVTLDRLAQAGDTILLADGEYDEPYSAAIKNNVVIMAEEGKHPVLNNKGYYELKASAKIIGVKFIFSGEASNGNAIYIRENTAKYLILEGCEFATYPKACITGSSSSSHIDSIIANNCYFHDNALSAIYCPASSLADNVNFCDKLKVTNSTFANTTTLNGAGILDNRNNGSNSLETSTMIVDHCTFYNCEGYERIMHAYKSPLFYVSNCIVANPTTPASGTYATYAYGGEVKNCLTFNNSGHRDWSPAPTLTANQVGDPKFVDAANGDYTLGEGSPALTMGTDGGAIGDPRWFPAVISAVPTEAAPVPTWPADQVKSLYSDTYTFAPASLNSYNEGWWDQPTLTEEAIDGNKFLHYNGRMTGMIGWQFGDISASIMEYIHVDIWPSANTTLKMGPTSPNPTVVAAVEITVEAGKWNSIDIPVSALLTAKPELNLADIFQNQFTNYGALTDLSIDNVYFYRTTPYVDEAAPTAFTATLDAASYFSATIKAKATDESGAVAFTIKNGDAIVGTGAAASGAEAIIKVAGLKAGTKYNLSVIASDDSGNAAEAIAVEVTTTTGPTPAATPKTYKGLVKSLYSDAYTTVASVNYYQEWWKGAPISTGELADGENVIFYGVAEEGASFGWAFDPIDLTEYPYLHVSVYPLAAGTIEIYPVQQGTADEAPYHRVSETLKANEWNELVYDFSAHDMTKIQQIGWCNYVSAQGFFVDNFYFSKSKEEVGAADRRINAYGLSVAADGDNYTFSYTANIDGTEANIVFYQNGVEKDAVAIAAPKKGLNQATIAKSDIPKGSNTWAVELKADQVFEFGKLAEGANLMKCHLAIDNSPESDFFGRMYVANRAGKADGGIYVYNQDYTVNTENTLAGQPKWQSMGRPSVGADGTVYIGDWGDAHGGVYVMNPSTLTATCLFEGDQDANGVWTNNGVALGSSTASVGVYGEGANTVLYAMNEDVSSAGTTLYAHGVNVYQLGQQDGSILSKWTVAPTKTFALSDNAAEMFVINATSKGAFFSCSRAKPNNAAGARSLQFYNTKGERTYVALPEGETADLTGSLGGGCAVSRDEDLLAIVDGDGNILVYSIAWTNDVPALTKVAKYETAFAALGSLCFDYAGNIVVTAGSNYNNSTANKLVAYGVPTENNEVIVPAKKALVVEGTNETTAIEDNFVPAKVEKVILNGQVLIIRDGKTYNMMGQTVK